MKKSFAALALPLILAACGRFHNADAGQPEVDTAATNNKVDDIVQCITDEAKKHDAKYKSTPIPQGTMLEFGDSNVVKVRYDNGETVYRFYPGERHPSNLWIEGAGKKCAP
jgi:protein involved in sex pheromone biosynthesis